MRKKNTVTVRARMGKDTFITIKKNLDSKKVSIAEFIRRSFAYYAEYGRFPYEVEIPNEGTTQCAAEEVVTKKDSKPEEEKDTSNPYHYPLLPNEAELFKDVYYEFETEDGREICPQSEKKDRTVSDWDPYGIFKKNNDEELKA